MSFSINIFLYIQSRAKDLLWSSFIRKGCLFVLSDAAELSTTWDTLVLAGWLCCSTSLGGFFCSNTEHGQLCCA